MIKERWNGKAWYTSPDQTHTNLKVFTRFRNNCLRSSMHKEWMETKTQGDPEVSGLFFVKQQEFPAEFDIAEFFINTKGKRFWMTPTPPTHWAEIETYEYI